MLNSKQFISTLNESTLNYSEKVMLIELIQKMDKEQIIEIQQLLEKDVKEQEKVFKLARLKLDVLKQKTEKVG